MKKLVLRGKPKMKVLRYKILLSTAERNWLTDMIRKELQFANEVLQDSTTHPYDREVYTQNKNCMESILVKLGEEVQ